MRSNFVIWVLFFLTTFALLFGNCLTVRAAENAVPELPAFDKHADYPYETFVYVNGIYYIYYSKEPMVLDASDSFILRASSTYYYSRYIVGDDVWESFSTGNPAYVVLNSSSASASFISTSYDVYAADGTLVFQVPAPPLVQIAKMIAPGMVLKEIISLTPLLIPCLVGYQALRKGLQFLSSILRQA